MELDATVEEVYEVKDEDARGLGITADGLEGLVEKGYPSPLEWLHRQADLGGVSCSEHYGLDTGTMELPEGWNFNKAAERFLDEFFIADLDEILDPGMGELGKREFDL